jgi:lipoate-protein ligase B
MRLVHLRLGKIPFSQASKLQATLSGQILAHKASQSAEKAPDATILTFEPSGPVYTLGLRQANSLSSEEMRILSADGAAKVHYTPRGGLTTFHGPGQMVASSILDLLRFPPVSGLRKYMHALERAGIATLDRFGIQGITTENPGVWVDEQKKIAAIGVNVRRYVTTHGVAINVETDLAWFERIVACGLEGKETTSLRREGVTKTSVSEIADVFVEQFATAIWDDTSDPIDVCTVNERSIRDVFNFPKNRT